MSTQSVASWVSTNEGKVLSSLLAKVAPCFRTRQAWLEWWEEYLAPSASRELFKKAVRLSDSRLSTMQKVMTALIERECFTNAKTSKSIERSPSRNTDWARTVCESVLRPPYPYLARVRQQCPGMLLQKALLGLARFLTSLYRDVHGQHNEDVIQLRRVIKYISQIRPSLSAIPPHSWNGRVIRALRMAVQNGEERDSVEDMIRLNRYWQGRFYPDDTERLSELLSTVADRCINGHLTNSDNAFELLWILAIADAATRIRNGDGKCVWCIVADEPIKPKSSGSRHPDIILLHRSGKLCCRISKSVPKRSELVATSKAVSDNILMPQDLYKSSLTSMGLSSERNLQPDIVLRFSKRISDPVDFFVLADAKRNASQNPTDYIRASIQKAILYMEVFKDFPGVASNDATIIPSFGFTLFFYQSTPKILDLLRSNQSGIVGKLNNIRTGREKSPSPIIALDMSCIADKNCPEGEDILAAWFNCVSQCADSANWQTLETFS